MSAGTSSGLAPEAPVESPRVYEAGEQLTAWLKERGFAFNHVLLFWEHELPGGQPPLRVSSEALAAAELEDVSEIKQRIGLALAEAGVGR